MSDRDVAILRLLAPHIRRAIAISDVLDMRAVEIDTFEASLDLIGTGILLVDGNATIIHADRAARAMLASTSPIRSEQGQLRTYLPETSAALRGAIAKAIGVTEWVRAGLELIAKDESIPLSDVLHEAVVAHLRRHGIKEPR